MIFNQLPRTYLAHHEHILPKQIIFCVRKFAKRFDFTTSSDFRTIVRMRQGDRNPLIKPTRCNITFSR